MQKFLIQLITAILFPLIDRLWDFLDSKIKEYQAKKKAKEDAEKARKKMAEASTPEKIDEAADDTLDGI